VLQYEVAASACSQGAIGTPTGEQFNVWVVESIGVKNILRRLPGTWDISIHLYMVGLVPPVSNTAGDPRG